MPTVLVSSSSRAPGDDARVSRVAHRAAQNGIDGHGEFGIPAEPGELPFEHFQALFRCGVRVHVVDADLQIIEAGAIETHDPLRRQQVPVGDQGRDGTATADVSDDVVQFRV